MAISAIRNPELKPYRVMLAGVDAFDEHHALAPTATMVRFKLRPRGGDASVDMADLQLRIAGETISIALPLAADSTFALPRNELAAAENADLLVNKKKGHYRWQADVHSASVPDGMRRLGDLRLECQVLVAIAKKEMPFFLRGMLNTLLLTTDWCMNEKIAIPTPTTRIVKSATLVNGERRVVLKVDDKGLGYTAPINDKTVPDNALVEVQFAREDAAAK